LAYATLPPIILCGALRRRASSSLTASSPLGGAAEIHLGSSVRWGGRPYAPPPLTGGCADPHPVNPAHTPSRTAPSHVSRSPHINIHSSSCCALVPSTPRGNSLLPIPRVPRP
jgi:hypothetical protein